MNFFIGVTDNKWYSFLKQEKPDDVNFWQPGGNVRFGSLNPGEIFLFKLKSPYNAIGGLGFFSQHSFLPLNMSWEIFGIKNGCNDIDVFRQMILNYRTDKYNYNPNIGCIVITNPIFFEEKDWIPVPENWSKSIVQGKKYQTGEPFGDYLWNEIQDRLPYYLGEADGKRTQLQIESNEINNQFKIILTKVRMGQGAFRLKLTEAYHRRCSITGERTLPVLEAAHIKPYTESGPHLLSNGLVLRSDLHKLFDDHYITITSDHKIEVSQRIRQEFENGKEYYQYHGKSLLFLPSQLTDQPGREYILWHNNKFK
jgi:putative restriction endonuclease